MIKLDHVTKKYAKGTALRDVNLELKKGKIVGLVGENGSGKSTTLKLIAGLTHPSKGNVTIDGVQTNRRIAKQASYLSELDEYYGFFNVEQTIQFFASQFPDFNRQKAKDICTFMKLDPAAKVKHLSKGNRGRLKIVLSLSRQVPVILMDEPLSGLDPMVRDSIVKSLISFIDLENQIVLITTHEIKEIEMILDDVIAIRDGNIVGHYNVEDLRHQRNMGIVDWMKEMHESRS